MANIWIGLAAGFGATLVLSVMMLGKQAMGLMPEFDMIGMIAGMMGGSRKVGWLVHFMAGTVVYGGAFVVLIILFGTAAYVLIGLLLGALGWGMAMVALMPMAGNGPFGTRLRAMVPVMSLVMHLLFGAVLGWIYGALVVA